MATKEELRQQPQRKLALSKETIRDLTPKRGTVDALRGGRRGESGGANCSWTATQDEASCAD